VMGQTFTLGGPDRVAREKQCIGQRLSDACTQQKLCQIDT
jgi:hypothetical protein